MAENKLGPLDFLTFQAQHLLLNTVELTWSLSSYEILSSKACKLTIIQQKNELCVYLEKIREYLCNYNDKTIGRSTNRKILMMIWIKFFIILKLL